MSEVQSASWRLFKRWTLNKLPLSLLENKHVLDISYKNNNRYTDSLREMGAKKVTRIDLYKNKKTKLPFPNNAFDFVFCNGVLQHTVNWKRGIQETHRVLKPGGGLWLMVYGKHRFYDLADQIRKKCNAKDAEALKTVLFGLNWQRNKVLFLDALLFDSRRYFTKKEVTKHLKQVGFTSIKHLSKGIDELDKEDAKMNLRFIAKKAGF